MAEALDFQAVSLTFPEEAPVVSVAELQLVDGVELRERLAASVPVPSLLDWLRAHYAHLNDATLLRLYHELINEPDWLFEQARTSELDRLRITHYPHGIFAR